MCGRGGGSRATLAGRAAPSSRASVRKLRIQLRKGGGWGPDRAARSRAAPLPPLQPLLQPARRSTQGPQGGGSGGGSGEARAQPSTGTTRPRLTRTPPEPGRNRLGTARPAPSSDASSRTLSCLPCPTRTLNFRDLGPPHWTPVQTDPGRLLRPDPENQNLSPLPADVSALGECVPSVSPRPSRDPGSSSGGPGSPGLADRADLAGPGRSRVLATPPLLLAQRFCHFAPLRPPTCTDRATLA